jgi:biotin-dependent carboxylase-like uncharacterized protein
VTVLVVRDCAPMTCLQDGGRTGSQRFGVSKSGAMDRLALAHANALAGNPPGAGAIEMMLTGGTFAIEEGQARIAVAGAPMAVTLNGEPLPVGRSATLGPGDVLAVGPAREGLFAYLSVAGGFAVAPDLGSVSLQPRAAIGGFGGRPFRPGDRVPLAADAPPAGPETALAAPPFAFDAPIRVVLGPQDDFFDADAIAAFLSNTYAVSGEADRMGFRLLGPAIAHLKGFNIVSDGIASGSIQVPGSGVPIVMLADHQTTGGYPKIATIVSADIRLLAQRRPGAPVRFAAVDMAAAQRAARERADEIARLPAALRPAGTGLPDVATLLGLNLAGAAIDAFAPEP